MIKKTILLLFLATSLQAATYYIAPTGNDTTGDGSTGTPWLTLKKGMATMSGGDTLIIKDGTYTGADNCITADQRPPIGSAGAWTIIKAEHDGAAVFDGENTTAMVNCGYIGNNDIHDPRDAYSHPMYYQFEGILWAEQGDTSPQFLRCRFVKFLRCGAYDAADGNNTNFNANRCADFLFENCYSYGSGRYKFTVYASTQVILRQCVARADRCNPSEVFALISMYSAVNCEVQNCIAIDSDQINNYLNVEAYSGSFCNPSTDADALNVTWTNCVALNNDLGGITDSGQTHHSINIDFNNCVLWDISNNYESLNYIRGLNDTINQCTFGVFHSTSGQFGFNSYDSDGDTNATLKNSILYNFTGMLEKESPGLIYDVENMDYLALYANDTDSTFGATIGDHSITTNSPIWTVSNSSGALKYIVRTETGNSLETSGEGGIQIGANCLKMVGVSGTMWGETGYNTLTDTDMWPFPYESLIKTKMAAYTYTTSPYNVTGARGFAAEGKQLNGTDDVTLTSYIWEYLGNEIPADIYGESEPAATAGITFSGVTVTGITIQ